MTRFVTNPGFGRGEVAPEYYGRIDAPFYPFAAKRLENMTVQPSGSATPRPAIVSMFSYGQDTITDPEGLPPGNYLGSDQIAMFGFRYAERDFLIVLRDLTTPTSAFVEVTVFRPTTFVNGEPQTFEVAGEFRDENYVRPRVFAPGTFPLPLPANNAYEFAQAGASVFITHAFMPPLRVIIDNLTATIEIPQFYEGLIGSVTPEGDGETTWNGTGTLFEEQLEPGDIVRFQGILYTVDTITDEETFTTDEPFSGPPVTDTMQVERDNIFEDVGFPALCAFHQQRLFLAGFKDAPVAVWASDAGDPFTILGSGVNDGDAINREALVQGADTFLWMTVSDRVYLGSGLGEYAIGGPSERITPSNFSVSRVGITGSRKTSPVSDGSSLFHLGATGTQVMQVVYDFQRQAFSTNNLSSLASHLTEEGLIKLSYRGPTRFDRVPRMTLLTQAGTLIQCSVSESEDVLAWTRITIPGQGTAVGSVRDVASTPETTFVLFSAGTRIHLARIEQRPRGGTGMDFMATRTVSSGSPTTTINFGDVSNPSGQARTELLERFDEVTVVRYDTPAGVFEEGAGQIIGTFELDGTTVELPEPLAGFFVAGVPFRKRIDLLVVGDQDGQGSKMNRRRRLVRVLVRGTNVYQVLANDLPLRANIGQVAGAAITPRDGYFEKRFLGWGNDDQLRLEIPDAFTGTILTVSREVSD